MPDPCLSPLIISKIQQGVNNRAYGKSYKNGNIFAGPDASVCGDGSGAVLHRPPPVRGVHRHHPAGRCRPQEPQSGPLNINTATAAQLETLDGIGPVLAQRIVEYRETNGPFASVEGLLEVKGLGPGILEAIRPQITAEEEP